MSDEPTPKDQSASGVPAANGGWVMPEPVYRSSPGRTPKTAAIDPESDIETEMPNSDQLDITLDQSEDLSNAETEEIPAVVRAAPIDKKKKGGCAKSFLFIIATIGIIAAALLLAVGYFLFYYRPADTVTF